MKILHDSYKKHGVSHFPPFNHTHVTVHTLLLPLRSWLFRRLSNFVEQHIFWYQMSQVKPFVCNNVGIITNGLYMNMHNRTFLWAIRIRVTWKPRIIPIKNTRFHTIVNLKIVICYCALVNLNRGVCLFMCCLSNVLHEWTHS